MKILGQLLVWGSLVVGAAAAATGYLASLDAGDEMLIDLTLAAPAGKIEQADGGAEPIAEKDQTVSFQLLRELRDAGVRNIRVKEFGIHRWRGKWLFLAAVGGLLAGAFLTRAGEGPVSGSPTAEGRRDSPRQTLAAMRTEIDELTIGLDGAPDRSGQLEAVVGRVGWLQKKHIPAFVEARSELVSMLGLAGYASLMDSFAAAERQLNRAWSAAVDGAWEEAVACVDEASSLLEETQERLNDSDKASAAWPTTAS